MTTPTKETIYRALRGDGAAQEECTRAGEALPCPFCGAEPMDCGYTQHWYECKECDASAGKLFGDRKRALAAWNTRAALQEMRDYAEVFRVEEDTP